MLVTVLGEIPDQEQALREIARVLRPGGRLVVGELFGDPHMVTSGKLRERASRAGLGFERRVGNPLAFFERFETRPPRRRDRRLSSRALDADRRLLVLLRTRLRTPASTGPGRAMHGRASPAGLWIALALGGAVVDRRRRGRWLAAALGVPLTLGLNYW